MNINDILKLDIKKSNLKKIDTFINKQDDSSLDYTRAIAYKAKMLYKLGDIKEAITILLKCENSTLDSNRLVYYYTELINIYLDLSDASKAMKYIELKEKNLSLLDKAEHTKDLILFYTKFADKDKAIYYINEYLNDDINEEDKVLVLSLLEDFYYLDNDNDKFNQYFSYLETKYKEKDNIKELEELYLKKLDLLFRLSSAEETKFFINNIDFSLFSEKIKIKAYTINIKLLIDEHSLRKAAILESEYENEIKDSEEIELLKEYYNTSLILYKELNNTFSIEYINKKLTLIDSNNNEKAKEKSKFNQLPEIIIKEKQIQPKEINPKDFEFKTSDIDSVNASENYKKFEPIFTYLNNASDIKSRELIRNILLKFSQNFKIYETHILDVDNKKGYLYKGGRLYDKKIGENINKSILFRCVELNEDLIINNLNDNYYNYDVINNETSPFASCLVFLLNKELANKFVIGFFFMDKDVKEYEYYKFISDIIGFVINRNKKTESNSLIKEAIDTLETKISWGYKRTEENNIILNDKARQMLKLSANNLSQDEYLMIIQDSDKAKYNNTILNLYNETIKDCVIEYSIVHNLIIKEHFYKLEGNVIVSYIEDITKYKQTMDDLLSFAYGDSLTDVLSFRSFKDDAKKILENHDKSLVFLNVSNFDLYLEMYGFEFSRQIIYAISRFLKANEKDYVTYHLEQSMFMLVCEKNDKRYLVKFISKLINDLKSHISLINKRVNLDIHAGIYKQSSKDKIKTVDEILNLTYEAYLDAMDKEEELIIFDETIYEDSYFKNYETELDISESIDKNELKFKLKPIYNMQNKTVIGYQYNFCFNNTLYDEEIFKRVINKRNLTTRIDKYLIRNMFEDLKLFHKETNYYFHAYISLSNKSLNDEKMFDYIVKMSQYYKVDLSNIYISVERSFIREYKESSLNLGSKNIDTFLKNDLSYVELDYASFRLDSLAKMKVLFKDKNIILSNVDSNNIENANLISSLVLVNDSKLFTLTDIINKTVNKEKK